MSPSSASGPTNTASRLPSENAPQFGVPSLLDEAWRLEPFVHPFTFSAFFSPEDTLLCAIASESARDLLPARAPRIAELTSGSGLVGFSLLRGDPAASLLGLDVDPEAARVAESNARLLGLTDRFRFVLSDLWSASTLKLLEAEQPELLICNPPYVPVPPGAKIQIEAGAGPHGTAHLLRALELTRLLQPGALALSWCSLSDPAGIVAAAEGSGYELRSLTVTAIADGEYSGSVHSYLRTLSDCYINEQPDTLDVLASDNSARFAYLLLAGAFERGDTRTAAAGTVKTICENFARDGVRTLAPAKAPFSINCSILTRWDELRLRAILHGSVRSRQESR